MEENEGFVFWRKKLNSAKFIVAPMVDQSELPWRLLSRRYGAELCYTPMLHAYVFTRDPVYRREALTTCPEDQPLIVQFCANEPEILLKAAKYAENSCVAVDLNLGCPQAIARRGHYGAFLQDEWDLLEKMISTCARELKVPITAKIRVFEDVEKTVRYAQMLERAGCKILTVHGRTKEQKGIYTGIANWSQIKAVKESVRIPVFANGNIQYLPDVHRCIEETGVDGVMTAEGNLHNPGLFDGREHNICDMALEYLELVEKYPCSISYVRGHVFKLLHHALQIHISVRDILSSAKTLATFRDAVRVLQICIQEDVENYEKNPESLENKLPLPYWICQPYERPDPEEAKDKTREKTINRDEEIEKLKRSLTMRGDITDDQEISRKKLKKMRRHQNKVFLMKEKEEKFPKCGCGNPKGLKCVFQCCKSCCKDAVFREQKNCPGHRVWMFKKSCVDQGSETSDRRTNTGTKNVTGNFIENARIITGCGAAGDCDNPEETSQVLSDTKLKIIDSNSTAIESGETQCETNGDVISSETAGNSESKVQHSNISGPTKSPVK